ncbi:unnamed protein product [Eruca vesicaria subsp. sativa]|uniref:F-box domain-containing protein n=1 Tax=Eruca vesicaria subsp. sativa TaxID=29727 RepID=A0ABC8JCH6_ERUVS|nr:unnamed protein product [Eruca vesicaria subsp. sativa]
MASKSKNEQSSQPPSLITSLPDDVMVDILARVPRQDYPALSLASKQFWSLIKSHEIYSRRSLLRCTETCLYTILSSRKAPNDRLYILRQNADGNRHLVHISSLLDLPKGESFVTVGSVIYGFGGRDDNETLTSLRAFRIDCRSHTVQPLPNMPVAMTDTCADFLDGKVYVVGYCSMKSELMMVVFNTKTQMWEPRVIIPDTTPDEKWHYGYMAVMANKIYMRRHDRGKSSVYEPKENKWEKDDVLSSKKWYVGGACVLDDVLYYYQRYMKCLYRYDPKESRWEEFTCLRYSLLAEQMRRPCWTETVRYGRNLALYFRTKKDPQKIWCAVISFKRSYVNDMRYTVEWCDQVLTGGKFTYVKCLSVMI